MKKVLSEDEQKQLLLLKSAYKMHNKTKEEALMRGKTKNIDKIDKVINEVLSEMRNIDPSFATNCIKETKNSGNEFDIMSAIDNAEDISVFDSLEQDRDNTTRDFYDMISDDDSVDLYQVADNIVDNSTEYTEGGDKTESSNQSSEVIDSFEQSVHVSDSDKVNNITPDDVIHNNVDQSEQFDLIPLPSKGECYKLKIDKIPVGYLTASDENLITSPNLYESGNITSILLKKKVLNKNIDVDNLVSGDVDAIMVFLRGTSYGNEFPIIATDPKNGKKIETSVDLSKLKYKSFTLKGDENGHFEFKLPRLKNTIKFKFLTKKEERLLEKINKKESNGVAVYDINNAIDKINNALKNDDNLNDADRAQIIDASSKLQKWVDNLNQNNKDSIPYTKTITNTMEMQIVSVDGNSDKKFIHNFVMNMPASDSLAFRRFIYDNRPGVDFEVEVQRPVSQGGGTFKCFLEWDDYVFWHIA